MAKLETFTLKVEGTQTIHCASCERAIQMALSQLPGVRRVTADHKAQLIEITTDVTQTGLDTILARLDWMGYEAVVRSASRG